MHVEIREARASFSQDLVRDRTVTERAPSELQDRALPRGDVPGALHCTVGELDDEPRLFEETLSSRGEADRSRAPIEQLHTQRAFQRFDLKRETRLRDPETLGRSPEMTLFSHGDEGP